MDKLFQGSHSKQEQYTIFIDVKQIYIKMSAIPNPIDSHLQVIFKLNGPETGTKPIYIDVNSVNSANKKQFLVFPHDDCTFS